MFEAGSDRSLTASGSAKSQNIEEKLEHAMERLAAARPFAKVSFQGPVLELAQRLLVEPDGIPRLYALVSRLDGAGVFAGTDWDAPDTLVPGLVTHTLQNGKPATVVIECLSELRMLAIAAGDYQDPRVAPDKAGEFLTQVLALNLQRLFHGQNEADRSRLGPLGASVGALFQFLLAEIGFKDILGRLIDEIWRILTQRPIQVGHVKGMITQIALSMARDTGEIGEARLGADRLVSALFGPTHGTLDDPGVAVYRSRLGAMDVASVRREGSGFARAMHDIGLVSDYHAIYLRWLVENGRKELIADALGLGTTGVAALRSHSDLIERLITDAIHPATAQAVYGLAMMLERGVLYDPPITPGLWRQVGLVLSKRSSDTLAAIFGDAHPPRVFLLAGVIALLGQPLGVGQGDNPTCQSARALSMWAHNDPDYLLHLVAHAARFDEILMHFEGGAISSTDLAESGVRAVYDTDPVSVVVVPHLDLIYNEMGRRCADRGEDPHRWINPELHGWWVGREFVIAVDVATGKLKDYQAFVEQFYGSYHPSYNGGQPVIHPQPAGLAATDSSGTFVGWHAISLLRVAPDQDGVVRVYFYNPNNDSGQNWGNGVIVSTQGHGERFGEASLPFPEMVSRLYIFHDDPLAERHAIDLPSGELEYVESLAVGSWAADRVPTDVEEAPPQEC